MRACVREFLCARSFCHHVFAHIVFPLVFLTASFWMLQDARLSAKEEEEHDRAIAESLQEAKVRAFVIKIYNTGAGIGIGPA
jgi:hypothetical protein